jgi:hypothetical protein
MGRDKWMHEYLHETVGARYAEGMTGTFTDTTFEILDGEFYDEDLEHENETETNAKILYHDGSAQWEWEADVRTPYKAVAGTLQFNNGTTLTAVDNNKYANYWVFITPDVDNPVNIVIGTAQYTTLALARAATLPSLGSLGTAENKLIYKITYQNNGGTPDYIEATDYRSSSNLPSTNYVATDHGSLAGLSDDDHAQYWIGGTNRTDTFSTSGNLGIGTFSPSGNIEIVKISATAPLMVSSTATGDGNWLLVTSTGNVGIGSATPVNTLQVGGSIWSTGYKASGNVGISTTAPSNGCKCAQYTGGICTTVGVCD